VKFLMGMTSGNRSSLPVEVRSCFRDKDLNVQQLHQCKNCASMVPSSPNFGVKRFFFGDQIYLHPFFFDYLL
jgi:hypothetical protein